MAYLVEPMRLADIPAVHEIELASFSSPWSGEAYRRDLTENNMAHYLVVRDRDGAPEAPAPPPPSLRQQITSWMQSLAVSNQASDPPGVQRPPIVGFAGIWLMVDEAHLVTIAVKPGYRGRGLGELILVSMIDWSCSMGAEHMTLEVRVSNHSAQELYRKYGFKVEGLRRRYYTDNGEDALIMTTGVLTSASYQGLFQSLKGKMKERVAAEVRVP